MADIEITCMPKDLPEFIEVDLMDVALGQTLHISDIKLPKGVESVELTKGESHDLAVVTVKTAKGPAVEDEDSAAEGDAEATEE
jgi:large subunit ribosomal protein L25